jgi:hypothetical protein
MHILLGILIFKGLTVRRLCKSFGLKRLMKVNESIVREAKEIARKMKIQFL